MDLSPGLVENNGKKYKLKKSLYDLKQSSNDGNPKLLLSKALDLVRRMLLFLGLLDRMCNGKY